MPDGPVVLRLLHRADNQPSPIDGKFVVEYDPTRIGSLPEGVPDVLGHLIVTARPAEAKHFPSAIAALEYWQQPSKRGRGPGDRPLTGYTALTQPHTDFATPAGQ